MNATIQKNTCSEAQRSPEWFKAREGRFTASQAKDLLTDGSRKMTEAELVEYKKLDPKGRRTTIDCIGDTAISLAISKATEDLIGYDDSDPLGNIPAIKNGRELEPLAFKLYKERMATEFLNVVEVGFCKMGDNAGASLDGWVSDNSSLEIKCPGREKFFRIVAKGIESLDDSWISQAQFQMMVCDTERCRFVVYFVEKGVEYIHEMIIEKDEAYIAQLKARLEELTVIKNSYKEILKLTLNL